VPASSGSSLLNLTVIITLLNICYRRWNMAVIDVVVAVEALACSTARQRMPAARNNRFKTCRRLRTGSTPGKG
jgi:hypothetical protein